MMERERERAVRFSNLEIEVLVDLIKTHILVKERRLECSSNAIKRKTWASITNEFWSRTASNRTEYQLLKKWKNLKHAARKYEAALRSKEQLGRVPPHSPIMEEVLDVIRREQEVMQNSFLGNDASIDTTGLPIKIKIEEEEADNYDSGIIDDHMDEVQTRNNRSSGLISLSNGIHLNPLEEQMPVQSQRVPYRHPTHVRNSFRNTEVNEQDDQESSDEALSVGRSSEAAQILLNPVSSMQTEQPTQSTGTSASTDSSNSSQLVKDKDLALKSAQLALLEKENKIKELDIRIKEEQLTDILLRRKYDHELHELRKKKLKEGLNDG